MTRETIVETVNSLLADEFEVESTLFAPEASVRETLSLDSLSLVDLVALVQANFKIKIPVSDLHTIQTFDDLYNYRDPRNGKRVVAFCMNKKEMELVGMGGPHCGDILVQLQPTYNMEHAASPSPVDNEGFSLGLVFIMCGSGIKKNTIINRKVREVDIVPTLCELANVRPSSNVEGGVIWQALEGFEEKKYN